MANLILAARTLVPAEVVSLMIERIDQHVCRDRKHRFFLSVEDQVKSSDNAPAAPVATPRDLTLWDCHCRENCLLCLASTLILGVTLALRRAGTQHATQIMRNRRLLPWPFDQTR